MAPVAMVLPSRAMATFPPARFSAMMPEPTTVASNIAVPTHSARQRRERSFNISLSLVSLAAAWCVRRRIKATAGPAILVIVLITPTLWLDQPKIAVGGPDKGVMAMIMLLAESLSLFMMLIAERLFRDMRTGAMPITSIAGGPHIIGGVLFLTTCPLAADGFLEKLAARAHMPPEKAAQVNLHVWFLPLELPLLIGVLALFAIGRAMRRASVVTDRSQGPD